MTNFDKLLDELTDRNPGAMRAVQDLMWLSSYTQAVVWLHKHGIRGSKLYCLWNDVFHGDKYKWCDAVKYAMNFQGVTNKRAVEGLRRFPSMSREEWQSMMSANEENESK
jgi:hypothetical protein